MSGRVMGMSDVGVYVMMDVSVSVDVMMLLYLLYCVVYVCGCVVYAPM